MVENKHLPISRPVERRVMHLFWREDMNKQKRKKRVTSPDDWHPTADDGTVEVSLIHDEKKAGWRVAVWGDDDFGMELTGLDITTGFDMFRVITDGVTKDVLRKRGFVEA